MAKTFFTLGDDHEFSAAFRNACDDVRAKGLRVSAGSWEDTASGTFCVSSVQTWGPATYNSPKACITGSI